MHFTGNKHTRNFHDFLLGVNGRVAPNFLKFDRLKLQSPEEFEKLNEHVNYGLTVCAVETKIKIRTFIPKEDIKIVTVCQPEAKHTVFYVNLHLNFDIEERYIPGIMNTKSIVNDFTFVFKDRDGYIKGDIYALKLLTLDSIKTLTFKQVSSKDGYCEIRQPTILKLLPKTQVRCVRLKVP